MKRSQGFIFNIILLCLLFLLVYAILKNSRILPKCHISKFVSYKNEEPYIVKGIVESEPVLKDKKTTLLLKAEAMQAGVSNRACCGNLLVNLKYKDEIKYGEELILRGYLRRPFGRNDRFGHSYRDYLYNQGIYFIMNVKTEADVVKLNINKGFPLTRFSVWLKQKMESIIFNHTSRITAAVLGAMILGEKRHIPWFVNNSMMKSGTLHILVVSGFNVGIVSFIIFLILKIIRLPRKPRFVLTIPLLIIYCLVTGASNPVMRATIMAIVFIIANLIKREPNIFNSLGIAAVLILMVNPRQLFDVGFQLSFASVLSIICIYPALSKLITTACSRKGGVYPKIKYIRFLVDGFLVSFSAWLGTMGFIAYYFRIFSPVTVLANIFIVPLAALITLSGISLIIISLIFPALAPFFAITAELEVFVLLKINAFLVSLPFAYLQFN